MSLHVVFSNRMEILGQLLMAELGRGPGDPFAPQHVIVPNAAVARSLQLAVARKLGICANVKFGFLGHWLWQLARSVDPSIPERSPIDPEVMSWLVLRLLEERRFTDFPRLAGFLAGADDLMRLDLARAVARVFDHYATYRPDWLAAWSAGRIIPEFRGQPLTEADEEWQRELWLAIGRALSLDGVHPLLSIFGNLSAPAPDRPEGTSSLPQSAAVFALPAIPPLYLHALRRLAAVMEITLYLLNPCRQYWFEIVPPRRLAYLATRRQDAHAEVGHELLADWGRATQAAIDLIYEEAVTAQASDTAEFQVPAGDTLLANLQRSLLDMEDLRPGGLSPGADDHSIEIHCCHGPVRELEVLQDRLLALFGEDRTLRCDDVAVLTPDIDALAPAVEAVFGAAPSGYFLPYAVVGRAPSRTNAYLRVLIETLELLSSRLPAGRVFELLRREPVARRFSLDREGLRRIRRWMNQAGIHWGLDGPHRREMGLPEEERHTFRRGLDMLFMGLALPELEEPLAGILPADGVEGSRAETLGGFRAFVKRLAHWKRRLEPPPAAGAWQEILNGILADFTRPAAHDQGEYDRVLGAIAILAESWRAAGLTHGLSTRIVRAALTDADTERRGAAPGGAITFASLAALGGLDYRVICLIGMGDDAFPVRERPREFDLIPKGRPRRGDRQRRREDRGIFLATLLAARDILHISYPGRDRRDNAELPPSVLVSQLRDYLARAISPADSAAAELGAARRRLTVVHPPQPFSRRYFDGSDPRLYSHAASYAAATGTPDSVTTTTGNNDYPDDDENGEPREPAPPFFTGMPATPADPGPDPPALTAADLESFLHNPSRFFLQRRLQIHLVRAEDIPRDEEPLIMGFTEERDLAGFVVAACEVRKRVLEFDEALEIIRARPACPSGAAAAAGLFRIWPALTRLATRLLTASNSPRLLPRRHVLTLEVRGKTWLLTVDSGDLRPEGIIRYRCDELRGFDHLQSWISHLTLCAVRPGGVAPATRHLAFDGDLYFDALSSEEARRFLTDLIGLYAAGLERPTPFFRRSAWAFAEKAGRQKIAAAQNKWRGVKDGQFEPEGADGWHALAWRGVADPLASPFPEIAALVFDPIMRYRTVTTLSPAGT